MSKFNIYRIFAPFRSRLQDRLRNERLGLNLSIFSQQLEDNDRYPAIAPALWKLLRGRAFIDDFRPEPDDDLYKVFAMDAEIVRDEFVDVLLDSLELSVSGIDFTGFDFASLKTPRDVSRFVATVADAQGGARKQRFVDMGLR